MARTRGLSRGVMATRLVVLAVCFIRDSRISETQVVPYTKYIRKKSGWGPGPVYQGQCERRGEVKVAER